MQYITTEELIKNALAAYESGRLTAQLPAEHARCLYFIEFDGRGCGCPVGVSLTEETLRALIDNDKNGDDVSDCYKYFACEDLIYARRLQSAHDSWCSAVSDCQELEADNRQAQFLEILHDGGA